MRRTLPLLFLPFLVTACGTDDPTGPSGTAINLAPVSLRDGTPVTGAVITPTATGVNIQAPGFLTRGTAHTRGTEQLWPSDAQMPESFTFEGAYASNPSARLARPVPGVMTVEYSRELADADRALDALTYGAAAINDVHKHLTMQLVPPGSGGKVKVFMDSAHPVWSQPGLENAGAVTMAYRDSRYTIIRGEIIFKSYSVFYGNHLRKAMSHELAHMAGIAGHPRGIPGVAPNGMMSSPDPDAQFTRPEIDLMNWMFARPNGTRWPDDSSGLPAGASASDGRVTGRIVCILK